MLVVSVARCNVSRTAPLGLQWASPASDGGEAGNDGCRLRRPHLDRRVPDAVPVGDGLRLSDGSCGVVCDKVDSHGDAVRPKGPDVEVVHVADASDALRGKQEAREWQTAKGAQPARPCCLTCRSVATAARSMCAGTVLRSVVMPCLTIPNVVKSCEAEEKTSGGNAIRRVYTHIGWVPRTTRIENRKVQMGSARRAEGTAQMTAAAIWQGGGEANGMLAWVQ